jgi:phage-related protein
MLSRKLKQYIEMSRVTEFISLQSEEVQDEYNDIVDKLETEGRLSMPFGEKLSGEKLFAIRVIHAGNIRVFYVYGKGDNIYGISAYEKKTMDIPHHELVLARRIARRLKQRGVI